MLERRGAGRYSLRGSKRGLDRRRGSTSGGHKGHALSAIRLDDLGALVPEALAEKTGVPPEETEDVYFGCANQAGKDNREVARVSLLLAGFP